MRRPSGDGSIGGGTSSPRRRRTEPHVAPDTADFGRAAGDGASAGRAAAPVPTPVPTPVPVRRAFVLWVTAVAAGAFETVLAVGDLATGGSGSAGEIAVGSPSASRLRRRAVGRRTDAGRTALARTTLALGLGVVGTASMVVDPLRALFRATHS
ncbi:hypothetical protein NKH77_23660 [Streptomyces sp. M19]